MSDSNAKERILENAVQIFSEKGFHGTSMRDIATASDCSLPNLYYHYKSKNDLFEEIVVNQFLIVTEKMNKKLDINAKPEDLYFQVLMTRKELKGFDKEVFKMALKVWLGFDGEGKARDQIIDWENKRASANKRIMDNAVRNENVREDLTEILINYMENVINRIILLDEDIDNERLRKQIALLFQIGK
ncbi:MAG: TetR/AcrR family transcriptional regulator [Eubacteriales bacterium]